jgi:hypothetical protein
VYLNDESFLEENLLKWVFRENEKVWVMQYKLLQLRSGLIRLKRPMNEIFCNA